jgi:hypothetical protein
MGVNDRGNHNFVPNNMVHDSGYLLLTNNRFSGIIMPVGKE